MHTIGGTKAAFVYSPPFIAVHVNFTFAASSLWVWLCQRVCCFCRAHVGDSPLPRGTDSSTPPSPIRNKQLIEKWLDGWLVTAWMDERRMTAWMDGRMDGSHIKPL